jgi:hypothetical protein
VDPVAEDLINMLQEVEILLQLPHHKVIMEELVVHQVVDMLVLVVAVQEQ